ncbi:MAG: hypothetical protein ACJAYK_002227 [Crocinitomicaceae bacterium]|jgi:hypothetical protein
MPMKMSKTIRKMNDKLVAAIKTVNDQATEELTGFVKLEHTVQFDLFPGSLLVNCYFENQQQLESSMKLEKEYQKKLQKLLLKQGIVLKDVKQNLKFLVKA